MLSQNLLILLYTILFVYLFLSSPTSTTDLPAQSSICTPVRYGIGCSHCFTAPHSNTSRLTLTTDRSAKLLSLSKCPEISCQELMQLIEDERPILSIDESTEIGEFVREAKIEVKEFEKWEVLGEGSRWAVLTLGATAGSVRIQYQDQPIGEVVRQGKVILFVVSLFLALLASRQHFKQSSFLSPMLTLIIITLTYLSPNSQHLNQPNPFFITGYSLFLFLTTKHINFSTTTSVFLSCCVFLVEWIRSQQVQSGQKLDLILCLFLAGMLFVVLIRLFLQETTRNRVIAFIGILMFCVSYVVAITVFKVHDVVTNTWVNLFAVNCVPVLLLVDRQGAAEVVKPKPYRVGEFEEDMQEVSQAEDFQESDNDMMRPSDRR